MAVPAFLREGQRAVLGVEVCPPVDQFLDPLRGLADGEIDAYVGDGPLITDDRPLPEYFLIRRLIDQTLR